MKNYKIVHLAPTPLVGAPSKISKVLNRVGIASNCIVCSDYPKALANMFLGESFVWNTATAEIKEYIINIIEEADILHIHNFLPKELLDIVIQLSIGKKVVYQIHSPLQEGPCYYPRVDSLPFPIDKKLVVAQYQPRQYSDYTYVPNINLFEKSVNLRKEGETLKVLFSPTHNRAGRWNGKSSERLNKLLRSLSTSRQITYISIDKPVPPEVLYAIRKSCHASIDEIITGAFHQVSLEGLSAGNVVINNADLFSRNVFKSVVNAQEDPPFFQIDESNCAERLLELANSESLTRYYQERSTSFFEGYLNPNTLAQRFVDIYDGVMDI
ncbi:hypothetical protein [Catenovulum sediminis]|uniref:Glycosyltransferase n=1 Tax=Catenovulum sediminis TaxID=1740262 RepID=A0ABV1RK69_9ALTE